jgi:hypothetical protein
VLEIAANASPGEGVTITGFNANGKHKDAASAYKMDTSKGGSVE